jgi:hypothetical protein
MLLQKFLCSFDIFVRAAEIAARASDVISILKNILVDGGVVF